MSFSDAVKLQKEGMIEATKYSQNSARAKVILLEKAGLPTNSPLYKKLNTELADEMSRSPIAFMMEQGVMQTIVEDLQTVNLERNMNRKPVTKLGNAILDRSPKWVNRFASQSIMAEDTWFYTWANNAVKLSDFSARYAYIKHLEIVKPDMTDNERLRKAMDEFVDYDIPTSQWIQYLNDIGLLWFTKYGLRTIGIAAELVIKHPDRIAALFMLEHLFGEVSTVLDFNPDGRIGNIFDRADGVEKIAPLAFLASFW